MLYDSFRKNIWDYIRQWSRENTRSIGIDEEKEGIGREDFFDAFE